MDASRRFMGWGGTALGLVLLAAAEEEQQDASPFVVTVGQAVARATPTAARASVMARAPLTGLLGLGQVGGELGVSLVAVADALVVSGRTNLSGAVLMIDAAGAHLESVGDLGGRTPAERIRLIRASLGAGATLTFGPGAEKDMHFASLAAGSAPSELASVDDVSGGRPSLVGRGGLGSVLARSGLQALHVAAPPPLGHSQQASSRRKKAQGDQIALQRALLRSPRLAQRAEQGTLELFSAEAARSASPGGPTQTDSLLTGTRSGCRGCPTPCGWSFRRKLEDAPLEPSAQPGRFSALRALGADIGLAQGSDALELLRRSDDLAVDAKEVGALLELVLAAIDRGRLAGPSPRGNRVLLLDLIDELVLGEGSRLTPHLQNAAKRGAAALAEALGLDHAGVQGATVRRAGSGLRGSVAAPASGALAGGLAALIGQCTSAGGADPMRTFPFLVEAMDCAELEAILGLALPEGADDPDRPEGKGLLAWWHQNLVAGIDLTGFCAFSAAGLLADGVCSLDEVAALILPDSLRAESSAEWAGLSAGQRLLSAGANIALFARVLDARWSPACESDRPEWAAQLLDHPELLAAHRSLRGIGADGQPRPEAVATLGSPGPGLALNLNAPGNRSIGAPEPPAPESAGAGPVILCADGGLARALEENLGPIDSERGGFVLELAQPQRVGSLLEELAGRHPELARLLMTQGRPLPAIWRAGHRLRADVWVKPGDRLELLLAIAGG